MLSEKFDIHCGICLVMLLFYYFYLIYLLTILIINVKNFDSFRDKKKKKKYFRGLFTNDVVLIVSSKWNMISLLRSCP